MIADGAAGYTRDADDDHVALPLGLVGLYWIRLFNPLFAANLPQTPDKPWRKKLSFVKDAFRGLGNLKNSGLNLTTA
jgi:hypothetical protein